MKQYLNCKSIVFLISLVLVFLLAAFLHWCYMEREHIAERRQNINSSVVEQPHKPSNSAMPVIAWWQVRHPGQAGPLQCRPGVQCEVQVRPRTRRTAWPHRVDAYLFQGSVFDITDAPPRSRGAVWGLYHDESLKSNDLFAHEIMLSIFNYSSTFSINSDVPFPLLFMPSLESVTDKLFFHITHTKNDIAPILYLQSDCGDQTERNQYVKELMKHIPVDCCGMCLKNELISQDSGHFYYDKILMFIRRYKFVLAIENGVCEDYITEKLWRSLEVGTVPIYFGSPSIRDWLPNEKSALLVEDYPTPRLLSERVYELLSNKALYEEYLEHKTKGAIRNKRFVYAYEMWPYQNDEYATRHVFECFVCMKLVERGPAGAVISERHYRCPPPRSALRLAAAPAARDVRAYDEHRFIVRKMYDKIVLGRH